MKLRKRIKGQGRGGKSYEKVNPTIPTYLGIFTTVTKKSFFSSSFFSLLSPFSIFFLLFFSTKTRSS